MNPHIFPNDDESVQRQNKETLLKQKSCVFWMTGLSGSGKSTLAKKLEHKLHERGFLTKRLDGDNLRAGINQNLGFTNTDRLENIRRAAEISKLFLNTGIITICAFISPTKHIRQLAQDIIGKADFYDIFVDCPFDVCAKRDVKGLYAKALSGEIKHLTGLDAPFEAPENPFLTIQTSQEDLESSTKKLLNAILPHITL